MGPVPLVRYLSKISTEIWINSFGPVFNFPRILEINRSKQKIYWFLHAGRRAPRRVQLASTQAGRRAPRRRIGTASYHRLPRRTEMHSGRKPSWLLLEMRSSPRGGMKAAVKTQGRYGGSSRSLWTHRRFSVRRRASQPSSTSGQTARRTDIGGLRAGSWARKEWRSDVLEMEKMTSHRERVEKGWWSGRRAEDDDELLPALSPDGKGHEAGLSPSSVLRERWGRMVWFETVRGLGCP
jgi:hypothetical protein